MPFSLSIDQWRVLNLVPRGGETLTDFPKGLDVQLEVMQKAQNEPKSKSYQLKITMETLLAHGSKVGNKLHFKANYSQIIEVKAILRYYNNA